MVLLLAVAAGLIAGLARAWIKKRKYLPPKLELSWFVLLAVVPQLFAFRFTSTSKLIPDSLASVILIGSQILLLIFVWANRSKSGFWALGLGLGMNLLVITLNRGWMPISPDTLRMLLPEVPADTWQIGARLGIGKDIILPVAETKLWWLSDRFLAPAWFPWRVAFSLGDIFISLGAFLLLWVSGDTKRQK